MGDDGGMQRKHKQLILLGFKKAFIKSLSFCLNLKGEAGFDKENIRVNSFQAEVGWPHILF